MDEWPQRKKRLVAECDEGIEEQPRQVNEWTGVCMNNRGGYDLLRLLMTNEGDTMADGR